MQSIERGDTPAPLGATTRAAAGRVRALGLQAPTRAGRFVRLLRQGRPTRTPEPRPGLTDEEARQIAERIVREVRQPPDPDNRDACSPAVGGQGLSDADEDRVERALIDLGAVSPEQTAVGTRALDLRDT